MEIFTVRKLRRRMKADYEKCKYVILSCITNSSNIQGPTYDVDESVIRERLTYAGKMITFFELKYKWEEGSLSSMQICKIIDDYSKYRENLMLFYDYAVIETTNKNGFKIK